MGPLPLFVFLLGFISISAAIRCYDGYNSTRYLQEKIVVDCPSSSDYCVTRIRNNDKSTWLLCDFEGEYTKARCVCDPLHCQCCCKGGLCNDVPAPFLSTTASRTTSTIATTETTDTTIVAETTKSRTALRTAETVVSLDTTTVEATSNTSVPSSTHSNYAGNTTNKFHLKLNTEKIDFDCKNIGEEPCVIILIITNTQSDQYLFKIKCTSNELFRIRPPLGCIQPGETESIKLIFNADKPVPDSGMHSFFLFYRKADGDIPARSAWAGKKPEAAKRLYVHFSHETKVTTKTTTEPVTTETLSTTPSATSFTESPTTETTTETAPAETIIDYPTTEISIIPTKIDAAPWFPSRTIPVSESLLSLLLWLGIFAAVFLLLVLIIIIVGIIVKSLSRG